MQSSPLSCVLSFFEDFRQLVSVYRPSKKMLLVYLGAASATKQLFVGHRELSTGPAIQRIGPAYSNVSPITVVISLCPLGILGCSK